MKGRKFNQIKIGDTDFYEKTITETDVYLFAGISGDNNSAHLNDVEAKKTVFKKRVVHGMLTASLISCVLGTRLPGPGTIYLGQNLKFIAPVYFGDTIKAVVTVIEKNNDKKILKLESNCYNQNGDIVIEGFATVMPPK